MKLTGQELKDRLLDHPNVVDDSVDVLDDQVTFRLINPNIPFPYKWKGCEVMNNDCEGYEDEYAVII